MPKDSIMVALIAEAHGARTLPRRVAASLLLDLLRLDSSDELFMSRQDVVEANETPEVIKELRALIDEHQLRRGFPR